MKKENKKNPLCIASLGTITKKNVNWIPVYLGMEFKVFVDYDLLIPHHKQLCQGKALMLESRLDFELFCYGHFFNFKKYGI